MNIRAMLTRDTVQYIDKIRGEDTILMRDEAFQYDCSDVQKLREEVISEFEKMKNQAQIIKN